MDVSNTVLISGSLIGARELMLELGADADRVAQEAGLPARAFDDPQLFVQAGWILDYLELAAATCRREDFGLLHARRLPLGMLGPAWMIMRAADTIEQAIFDFVTLYGLYTDAGTLRTARDDRGLWIQSSFLPVGRFGATQAISLTLGAICLFIQENLSAAWQPLRVDLRHTPANPEPFISFFGPGVRFGQTRDALLVGARVLASRMGEGTERNIVHEVLLSRTSTHRTAIVAQVKALLSGFLRHDACTIELICEALSISPRPLQRRLAAANTNYRTLLDEARADLAWRHVMGSELSLSRIADVLGYRSPAAFSRAFRRWHQMSPRAARRR